MNQETTTVSTSGFRALMAGFPTGVVVVTTVDVDGRPWGMTCSSVCGVALAPPTLLVCVRQESPTLEAIARRSTFAVNLLQDGSQSVAELFASGAADRFDRVRWDSGVGGPHLADAAHTIADCAVSQLHEVGDHVVVYGEVLRVTHRTWQRPLLYGLRQYAVWPAAVEQPT